jgi:carboxyl-terminal processing protease
LKLTIARYYTPSGRSIQAKGVEPDIVVQHQILEAEPVEQKRLFKEKDLANHLDAEPEKQQTEGDPEQETPADDAAATAAQSRLSPLNADQLMTDSQVRRAMDILISYDIFQKLGNG